MQVYGILLNSRDLTGAIDVSVQAQDQKISNEAIYQALAKEKDFSVVRNSSGLKSIIDMGVDAVAGTRAALAAKAELCPDVVEDVFEQNEYGWEAKSFRKRPGYVFAKGVCIEETVNGDPIEQVLANVEMALRGQTLMKEFVERDGTRHEFEVKPAVAFTEPIQDLKVLEPKFDRCGTGVVEVADGSLGGLIVNGDINVVLRDKDIYSQFPEAECAR